MAFDGTVFDQQGYSCHFSVTSNTGNLTCEI